MDTEKMSKEFMKMRENLHKIANLIINGNDREAIFMIGCLHQFCHITSISLNPSETLKEEGNENAGN